MSSAKPWSDAPSLDASCAVAAAAPDAPASAFDARGGGSPGEAASFKLSSYVFGSVAWSAATSCSRSARRFFISSTTSRRSSSFRETVFEVRVFLNRTTSAWSSAYSFAVATRRADFSRKAPTKGATRFSRSYFVAGTTSHGNGSFKADSLTSLISLAEGKTTSAATPRSCVDAPPGR